MAAALVAGVLMSAVMVGVAVPAQATWQAPGFLRSIGGRGEAGIYAWGIQYNPFSNEMLVGDYWNFKVRRYDMQGHLLGSFFRAASLRKGQPYTLSVDPTNGDIYVPELSDGLPKGYFAHYDMVGNYIGEIHVSASYHVWATIDASRNLWVADAHNNTSPKVREYNLDTGASITSFGTYGSGPGQLGKELHGVATDTSGNVYVADATNLKVHVYTPTGTWLRDIGSAGNAVGQFDGDLRGIAIDKTHGWLYVVDADAAEIEKFDLNGNPLGHWGTEGQGFGQFADGGRQLTVDATGNVWVADYGNFRFMEFDSNGALLGTFPDPAQPPAPGNFSQNRDVAVNTATGAVWAADSWNNRFQKFAPDGTFQGAWGYRNSHPPYGFDYPRGIAVDPATGQTWVVSTRDHLIRVYDASGNYIRQVGSGLDSTATGSLKWPMDVDFYGGKAYIADYTSNYVKIFDAASGTELSKISHSNNGVAVDPATGNIYVVSWSTDKVYEYSPSGSSLIRSWGSTGSGNGQFQNPWDLDIVNGTLYVTDAQLSRVQAFDLSGNYVGQWGSSGTGAYQFNNPSGISHDAAGNIYIADAENDRIQVFSPSVAIPSGDTTLPTATLTSPTANQVLPAQLVTVSGSVTDNVGIAKAEVAVQNVATTLWWSAKDASWVTAKTWNIGAWSGSTLAPTYAFSFVGVSYSTQYMVQAKATDTSGNTAVSTPTVKFSTQGPNTIDTTAPSTSITAPTLDQVMPFGPVTIAGVANDDLSGIASAQVAIKDRVSGLWWDPSTSTWGVPIRWISATLAQPGAVSTAWSYVWPSGVHGGSYYVQARTTDNANNVSTGQPFTRFTVT